MALINQKINHVTLLDEWLNEPHKLGHLLGYEKLTPLHGEWIKIFIRYAKFDVLQAHRGSYKTTCGIVAMVLLFLCSPATRLLIVRKNSSLASDVLKTIQKHFETNDILRLYVFSRWNIVDAKTNIWSSERTMFSFKKTVTPEASITAAGVGASITGAHFDYIWSDDIVTIEDRYSPAAREWAKAYFRELDNLIDPLGQTRLSGTPWHEEDVFSTIEEKYFEGRRFPVGTVQMPEDELIEIMARKERLPYAEWCCNYELRHVLDQDTIGAFLSISHWSCQYCVAFIDPSFSDRTGTDFTCVAVVGVDKTGLLTFTGMILQKSIGDREVRRQTLDFLDRFHPIETVIEAQLQPSSNVFFLDIMKTEERAYAVKNLWSIKHQSRNKHERISTIIIGNKPDMRILEGTQQEFSLQVSRYYKNAAHDDAPDALAGAIETLGTSPIVAEYSNAIRMLRR
jgi:hypothetical protein